MTNTTYTYTPTENHLDLRSGRTNATIWRNELGDIMLELCPDSDADAGVQLRLDWRSAHILGQALINSVSLQEHKHTRAATNATWSTLVQELRGLDFLNGDGGYGMPHYTLELSDMLYLEVVHTNDGAFALYRNSEDGSDLLLSTTSADELLAHAQRVIDLANAEQALATYVQIDKALSEV